MAKFTIDHSIQNSNFLFPHIQQGWKPNFSILNSIEKAAHTRKSTEAPHPLYISLLERVVKTSVFFINNGDDAAMMFSRKDLFPDGSQLLSVTFSAENRRIG